MHSSADLIVMVLSCVVQEVKDTMDKEALYKILMESNAVEMVALISHHFVFLCLFCLYFDKVKYPAVKVMRRRFFTRVDQKFLQSKNNKSYISMLF